MTFATLIAPAIQGSAALFSLQRHPMLWSTSFIITNIVATVSVATMSAIANKRYMAALRVGEILLSVVDKAGTAFASGSANLEAVDAIQAQIIQLLEGLEVVSEAFLVVWKAVWIVYACLTGALVVVSVEALY